MRKFILLFIFQVNSVLFNCNTCVAQKESFDYFELRTIMVAKLRSSPFVGDDNVIIEIPEKTTVIVFGKCQDDYLMVQYGNFVGFVNSVCFKGQDFSTIIVKIPYYSEKMLYDLASVSVMVKRIVKPKINNWQKKDEFESSENYKLRVNEKSRELKIRELSEETILDLKKEREKRLKIDDFMLSEYDADNESFLIKTVGYGEITIKVRVEKAPDFKKYWNKMKFSNVDFTIKNDQFCISKIEFYYSKRKGLYSYDNKNTATYENVQVNYNFAPIEIDLKESKADKKTKANNLIDIETDIPENSKTNTNYFAVIIGNENYKNEVKVNYAINDAKIVKKYFNMTLGIPLSNIHYLENATYGQMLSEIDWLKNISKAFNGKVNIYFYYAGHGIPNEETKNAYLLPVDGNSRLTKSAIKTEEVYNQLSQYNSQLVSVFLDACFSGAAREGSLLESRGIGIKPKGDLLQGNIIVMSATSEDETAYPYNEMKHGLFTYFLIKKIKESKGNITYSELSEYIKISVNQQSIIVNQKSQSPQISTSPEFKDIWKNIKIQ